MPSSNEIEVGGVTLIICDVCGATVARRAGIPVGIANGTAARTLALPMYLERRRGGCASRSYTDRLLGYHGQVRVDTDGSVRPNPPAPPNI